MTDSNLVRLTRVTESTYGTTPGSPEMTKVRVTGITIKYDINNIRSEEIRSDRLTPDLIQVGARVNGGFGFELSYGAFDEELESLMFSTWQNMPVLLNLTSDSTITNVTDSSDTFTVASGGGSFKAGHLIRTSGFTNSANNGLFKVSSSTGTTVVVAGTPTLTDESAPPAGARIKVIGFQGASGDITATSTGLGSTSLDFTTLGLSVGQWIKIGGSAAGDKFATAALNSFARITAIAATALTLDNRPTGWTTDAGSSKTIIVYTADYMRIGTTAKSFAYEEGFMGQDTPSYCVFNGVEIASMSLNIEAGAIVTGSFEFLGKVESCSTTSLDSTPTEAPTNDVLNAVNNVARISEGGSAIVSPNYAKRLNFTVNNNLRERMAIGTLGLIGIGVGDADVTGSVMTYFGDLTTYQKFTNGTATSLFTVVAKDSRANVFSFPKVKFEQGNKDASARNQDVMVELPFRALRDTNGHQFQIDRFEEYAA